MGAASIGHRRKHRTVACRVSLRRCEPDQVRGVHSQPGCSVDPQRTPPVIRQNVDVLCADGRRVFQQTARQPQACVISSHSRCGDALSVGVGRPADGKKFRFSREGSPPAQRPAPALMRRAHRVQGTARRTTRERADPAQAYRMADDEQAALSGDGYSRGRSHITRENRTKLTSPLSGSCSIRISVYSIVGLSPLLFFFPFRSMNIVVWGSSPVPSAFA